MTILGASDMVVVLVWMGEKMVFVVWTICLLMVVIEGWYVYVCVWVCACKLLCVLVCVCVYTV